MGIMITDPEIIESLTYLSERMGVTKATVLKQCLLESATKLNMSNEDVFARDRVEYCTYII